MLPNSNPDSQSAPFQPRRATPRAWFQAGFFAALGAAVLLVLAIVARRLFFATLAVITPVALGVILALLLDPLVHRLQRRGLSRFIAVALVFAVFLVLLGGLSYLAVPALIHQAAHLAKAGPQYVGGIQITINDYLARHRHLGPFKLPRNTDALLGQVSARASAIVQQSAGHLTGFLLGWATLVVQMVLALIVTFFMLADLDRLRARLFYLVPEKWRAPMKQYGADIGGVFSDYLRGLLIVCVLYGVCTILILYGLSLWHHQLAAYALLIGVVAGVLYAIPYLGPLATILITFLVAFAAGGIGFGGVSIIFTVILEQVFDDIVTPRVVGGGVGLHPVIALFALLLGGELFGLWGLLLSVPVAASIQIVLFRLFPRLTAPTPAIFLRAEGVPPDQKQASKVMEGDEPSLAPEKNDAPEKLSQEG